MRAAAAIALAAAQALGGCSIARDAGGISIADAPPAASGASSAGGAPRRLEVLLTNDDGIDGLGLDVLRDAFAARTDRYEVTVVAPTSNRSGSGMSKTRGDLPTVRRAPRVYALAGTPSDCVAAGLTALVERPPDIVISGLNSGSNLGRVALTSGTVGAAMTAASMGARGIAVSVGALDGDDPTRLHFTDAAELTLALVEIVTARPELLPHGTMLSVNYPARPRTQIRGVKVVRQSPVLRKERRFRAAPASARRHDVGRIVLERRRSEPARGYGPSDTDLAAFRDGWITVTPMDGDWTASALLAPLGERLRTLEAPADRP